MGVYCIENKNKLFVVLSAFLVTVLVIGVIVLVQTPTGQGELTTVSYNDELFRVGVEDSDFTSREIGYGELMDLLFENIDMRDMDIFNHIAEINYKYVDMEQPSIIKTSQFVNVGNENNQYIVEVVGTYLVDYNTKEIVDCYGMWTKASSDGFLWSEYNVTDTTAYPSNGAFMSIRGRAMVDCSSIFSSKKVENLETAGFVNIKSGKENICEKMVTLHVSCDALGM